MPTPMDVGAVDARNLKKDTGWGSKGSKGGKGGGKDKGKGKDPSGKAKGNPKSDKLQEMA